MPDIREVLAALDDNDKRLWSLHRTEMRRSYMTAHNSVIGMAAWDFNDDAFIDLIDIKLATLFDRAGRLVATKPIIGNEAEKIEAAILSDDDKMKKNEERLNNWRNEQPKIGTQLRVRLPDDFIIKDGPVMTTISNGSLANVDRAVAKEQQTRFTQEWPKS